MGRELAANWVLWAALSALFLAQALKVPLGWLQERRWQWGLLVSPGGMPSSHAALMAAATLGVGLAQGFASPLFGLAVAVSLIVVYDATGIRRQAGEHAALINRIVAQLQAGHLPPGDTLREVLGHTPWEAFWGVALGLATAWLWWWVQQGL